MKKLVGILVVFCASALLTPNLANAQAYKTGIGFRAGGLTQGITFKHFTGPDVDMLN